MFMMPALSVDSSPSARHEAELGAMVILQAAGRHRLRTGDRPESIADIGPEVLPDPPVDPFTEDDDRTEHRDDRLLISSVGPNRRDDRGAYAPRSRTMDAPDDAGVIGWDVERRRQPALSQQDEARDETPGAP